MTETYFIMLLLKNIDFVSISILQRNGAGRRGKRIRVRGLEGGRELYSDMGAGNSEIQKLGQ